MRARTVMVVAGDPSGDALAADLMREVDELWRDPVRFIGAGGPKMAGTGAKLEFDLTQDAVIGLDFLKKLSRFSQHIKRLVRLALEQRPEAVILVDFSVFNHRLAQQLRQASSNEWRPKIIKYVSPQVWASRPWRARTMGRDFDLLLCLFPFEKEWFGRHAPDLRVEFVGHPMFDRYGPVIPRPAGGAWVVALLPGSRRAELTRHLPVMAAGAREIQRRQPSQFRMALPNEEMAALAESLLPLETPPIDITVGNLEEVLRGASLAIASTGTVTLECAYFGVPTVAMYKTSWLTYVLGRMLVRVKHLAMPNLLSDEPVFPEFIQGDATADNISKAALDLLEKPEKRRKVQLRLGEIIETLGGSGASRRAAEAIVALLDKPLA